MKGRINPAPYTRDEYDTLMDARTRNLLDEPIQRRQLAIAQPDPATSPIDAALAEAGLL